MLLVLGISARAQTAADPNEGLQLTRNATSGAVTVAWWGKVGWTYCIQYSEDLTTWKYFPVIEYREDLDDPISWGFTSNKEKLFLRLEFDDQTSIDPETDDFDADGMNNLWEVRSNFSLWTWNDPNANPDGDDTTNLQEATANTSPTDPAPVLTLSGPVGASLVP